MIKKGLLRHGLLYERERSIAIYPESNYWICDRGVDVIRYLLSEQTRCDGYPERIIINIERIKYILHFRDEEYRIDYTYCVNMCGSTKSMTFFTGSRHKSLGNDIEKYLDSYILAKIRERKLDEVGI